MMFKDIKVGDEVLGFTEVMYGWGLSERFLIKCRVEKVTPKSIMIGRDRYKKKDGQLIGGYNQVWPLSSIGDKTNNWKVAGGIIKDQTKERDLFQAYVNNCSKIRDYGEALSRFKVEAHHDQETVNKVQDSLSEIMSMINGMQTND